MALALYRKYRPRTFAEIIGQEHVTEPLSQALRSDRLHHAYLFSGPRGCGKTSSARILARSLNCEKGPTPDPCGECESCRALAPDGAGSIDVIEIDAASHGGVDDARDLRERAFFAPVSSRYKIYVIDEAHMVSSAGFNALLKLVEEPPDYVKFVFATTEPEKVLGTIKSRTHHYPFRLIPPGVLRPYLEQLCVAEGVAVEPAVFPLVVRAGGGSARDSLSVLDQLISGAGPEGVKYARAVALLGVTDVALIDEVCDALAAGDGRAVYTTIDRVAEAGHDARRFAGDLLERLRDLIVLQHVPDAVDKGLLDGADDELARMTVQASQFGPATLSRMADIVHTGLTDMRGTTAPRLVLELITARMLLPGSEDSSSALLSRMERMERRLTLSGGDDADYDSAAPAPITRPAAAAPRPTVSSAPAQADPAQTASTRTASARAGSVQAGPAVQTAPGQTLSAEPAASGSTSDDPPRDMTAAEPTPTAASGAASSGADAAATPAAPTRSTTTSGGDHLRGDPASAGPEAPTAVRRADAAPGAIDAAAVRRIWEEVITMVRRKSPRAAAVVREATVRDVDGDVLVLTFKHAFHAEAVAGSPELLIDAVYEVLGGRWRVRCEVAGQTTSSPAVGGAPRGGGRPAASGPAGNSGPAARASAGAAQTTPAQTVTAQTASLPASGGAPRQTSSSATATDNSSSDAEEDWPATATLGGSGADGGVPPAQPPAAAPAALAATRRATAVTATVSAPSAVAVGPTRATSAPNTAMQTAAPVAAAPTRAAPTAATAREQARAAAAGRAAGASRGAPASTGRDDAWAGIGADEPPYDPEFDPPVRGVDTAAHVGFDPGDEPVDDEGDTTTRQTSEQAAVELLRQTLGAERIG